MSSAAIFVWPFNLDAIPPCLMRLCICLLIALPKKVYGDYRTHIVRSKKVLKGNNFANHSDIDQTALAGAVCSGSTVCQL